MKSLVSESVKNDYLNLERLSVLPALRMLSQEFRLWNDFDSDVELVMYRA